MINPFIENGNYMNHLETSKYDIISLANSSDRAVARLQGLSSTPTCGIYVCFV